MLSIENGHAQKKVFPPANISKMNNTQSKMLVEIWSDVMCPFCYIGKRRFEQALAEFPERDQIRIVWKSFQLSPDMKTDTSKNINQFLSEHKGISLKEAQRLNSQVTQMAAREGLVYDFDKAVVANSFHAHRFTHFAKQYNKQPEAEEILFRAYFTEGKNIDDYSTLVLLGKEIGLDEAEVRSALESNAFSAEVVSDIEEAEMLGLQGVPFFVFNRRYAVSGAQDPKVFLDTLEKAFEEWSLAESKK